jgi:hypothetical protein
MRVYGEDCNRQNNSWGTAVGGRIGVDAKLGPSWFGTMIYYSAPPHPPPSRVRAHPHTHLLRNYAYTTCVLYCIATVYCCGIMHTQPVFCIASQRCCAHTRTHRKSKKLNHNNDTKKITHNHACRQTLAHAVQFPTHLLLTPSCGTMFVVGVPKCDTLKYYLPDDDFGHGDNYRNQEFPMYTHRTNMFSA